CEELPHQLREVGAYGYCKWTTIPNVDLIVNIGEVIVEELHLKLSFYMDGPLLLKGHIIMSHYSKPKMQFCNTLGLIRSDVYSCDRTRISIGNLSNMTSVSPMAATHSVDPNLFQHQYSSSRYTSLSHTQSFTTQNDDLPLRKSSLYLSWGKS
ncbi:hypothetical protein HAX54_031696, partial [Datura stramonium]|nr:hypothetical protein [Datura stramonium]